MNAPGGANALLLVAFASPPQTPTAKQPASAKNTAHASQSMACARQSAIPTALLPWLASSMESAPPGRACAWRFRTASVGGNRCAPSKGCASQERTERASPPPTLTAPTRTCAGRKDDAPRSREGAWRCSTTTVVGLLRAARVGCALLETTAGASRGRRAIARVRRGVERMVCARSITESAWRTRETAWRRRSVESEGCVQRWEGCAASTPTRTARVRCRARRWACVQSGAGVAWQLRTAIARRRKHA